MSTIGVPAPTGLDESGLQSLAVLYRETERRNTARLLLGRLTRRELEVTLLISEGLPNKSIAQNLGLAEGTIKLHLHRIYHKLCIPNRAMLAALAIRAEFFDHSAARHPGRRAGPAQAHSHHKSEVGGNDGL